MDDGGWQGRFFGLGLLALVGLFVGRRCKGRDECTFGATANWGWGGEAVAGELGEDFLFGVGESTEAPGEGGDLGEQGFLEDGFGLEFFLEFVFEDLVGGAALGGVVGFFGAEVGCGTEAVL